MIVAGSITGDAETTESGMRLLAWLIKTESMGGHFSFTPTRGRESGDRKPAFDQQCIEAWAMADACFAAFHVESHRGWRDGVVRASDWFLGLYDSETGAGYDGVHSSDVNANRGAESTLAALGALIRRHQVEGRAASV
jgi:hypothetical protein